MMKSLLPYILLAILPAGALALDIDLDTQRQLQESRPDAIRQVLVHLPGKADLDQVVAQAQGQSQSRDQRVQRVVEALKTFLRRGAAPIRRYLNLRDDDTIQVTELWITNSLRVRATTATIDGMIALGVGETVTLERAQPVEELRDLGRPWSFTPTWGEPELGWGLRHIGAPDVWKQGVRGQGVTVAVIDSGANTAHPDLAPNLWTNPGEIPANGIDDDGNGYIDDIHGWNFEAQNTDLSDHEGHGTKSAGIVAGNGAGGLQTGVAPAAKLMILRSCCDSLQSLFESHAWEAMQYAVENGARLISMSLSVKPSGKPSYARWRRAGEALLAADILQVNSSGNLGSRNTPRNIGAPASNPPAWFHPGQVAGLPSSMIAVGAVDEQDHPRRYSGTGPVTWEAIPDYHDYPYDGGRLPGLIKPEVCAPSQVPSLDAKGAGYIRNFGGTSSATPHVAGLAALLLSAQPGLTVAQLTEAIEMSAVPVGEGYNNQCGAGRVAAPSALQYVCAHFR